MSTPVIGFLSNRSGVGTTSLVYHLAWIYRDLGRRVLVADLDPQANLTAAFLEDDRLEQLWPDAGHPSTIYGAVLSVDSSVDDGREKPHVESLSPGLGLIPGDLGLAAVFEYQLSRLWLLGVSGGESKLAILQAFQFWSAFWRVLQRAAALRGAEFILIDLGPGLDAISRASLLASDYLAIPVAPDLLSWQALSNIGWTIRRCKAEWANWRAENPDVTLELPAARVKPVGYVVMEHAESMSWTGRAQERWARRISEDYSMELFQTTASFPDEHLLARVKDYRSLMSMAKEARKPMFHLTSADGAIGAHAKAVAVARENFSKLALELLKRCNLTQSVPASL